MSTLDTITAFLRGKGLTPAQIAGVEGNLQVESGFRPDAFNPREGAIGLAQWENGRRTNLQQHAAGMGTTERDLNAQLSFLWAELTGPEHSALVALQGTTTPADAAAVFDQKFERSAGTSRAARIAAANALFPQAGGTGPAPGGTSGDFAGQHGTGSAGSTPAAPLPDWLAAIGRAVNPAFALANPGDGEGLLGATFGKIGTWIVDGFLILAGGVMIVVALVLVAKGAESHAAPAVPADGGPADGEPAGEGKGKGKRAGVTGAAEDAGETAAVAA